MSNNFNKDKENSNIEWINLENNSDGLPHGKYAFVTINPKKSSTRFYISSKALKLIKENYGTDDFKLIRIGININDRKIAIKPLVQYESGAITIYNNNRKDKTNNTRSFSSKKLMEKIKPMIPDDKTRFKVEWNNELGALIVNLNKKLEMSSDNKWKKK